MFGISYFKGQPTDHVLQFSGGRVVREGLGQSFFFWRYKTQIVAVPVNLCAKVPEGVGDEEAVFTVLGSIALQGVRLAAPTLGECFVVTGLGIIGLITAQLLKANGCRVLGLDFDENRLKLASSYGICLLYTSPSPRD